ncbi:taste receptor type 2 member 60 [Oryctolagus cuniculus]|uniref:Taste receptor type 2 n=1 Tax=Oryctolagus cuniculus TaxID=9986 RepID=A0A5F9CBA3_RABIT|nr:taste receptor type 2 member 60 [Oryctolagus cuniculus]
MSYKTLQSNPTEAALETWRPSLFTGKQDGNYLILGYSAIDTKIIVLAIILLFLCLVAVVGNGIITATLGMNWLLQRTLSPCDKLLVSLGASRFFLQWVVLCRNIYVFLHPTVFPYNNVLRFLAIYWDFLSAVTLWFSTWLSVFYCVKITTFTHPVFLWLKHRVSRWVPWMLLSSVGFSALSTVLLFMGNQSIYQNYLRTDGQSWNVTGNNMRSSCEKFYLFPIKAITWLVPTLIFLICMVLLLTSLGRHTKKVLLSLSGSQDPSAQAHIKALLALISFAILFTSYSLSMMLTAAGIFPSQEFRYWVWQVLIYLCAAVHPFILLCTNHKLKAVLEKGCCSRNEASGAAADDHL